jgi:peroxiredoxin
VAAPAAEPLTSTAASNDAAQTEAESADDAPESSGRAWLGVELESAGPDQAGVRIIRVVPHSPAESAGLAPGDVIVRLDNDAVAAPGDVVAQVSTRRPASRVGVMLKRNGADRLIAVKLGAFPDQDELMRMTFVDQPAPAFELVQPAKGNVPPTLTSLRGQVVVLEFWAPWCVACRAMIPQMNQWYEKYSARGLHVIGITNETVARAATAATDLGMEYSILADESGKTSNAYQAHAIPAVFVIDRAGTVRDVMIGYDRDHFGKIDELMRKLLAES